MFNSYDSFGAFGSYYSSWGWDLGGTGVYGGSYGNWYNPVFGSGGLFGGNLFGHGFGYYGGWGYSPYAYGWGGWSPSYFNDPGTISAADPANKLIEFDSNIHAWNSVIITATSTLVAAKRLAPASIDALMGVATVTASFGVGSMAIAMIEQVTESGSQMTSLVQQFEDFISNQFRDWRRTVKISTPIGTGSLVNTLLTSAEADPAGLAQGAIGLIAAAAINSLPGGRAILQAAPIGGLIAASLADGLFVQGDHPIFGNIEAINRFQQRELGYTQPETAPKFRVPVYYVDSPSWVVSAVFSSDGEPVFVGYYYPERGYIEHVPKDGIDLALGHGYRVSVARLMEEIGASGTTDDWNAWFKENHNPTLNNSANNQLRVELGLEKPDFHNQIHRFQNTAEILAHVNIAFYGLATGLAQPSASVTAVKATIQGRRIFDTDSVWRLGPGDRGFAVEKMLGGNLPKNFETIDRFQDGIATSIKTLNLADKTYREVQSLKGARAINKLVTKYIDDVATYQGGVGSNFRITLPMIRGRALDLAIPVRSASPMQVAELNSLVTYGRSKGVVVNIIEIR